MQLVTGLRHARRTRCVFFKMQVSSVLPGCVLLIVMNSRRFNRPNCIAPLPAKTAFAGYRIGEDQSGGYARHLATGQLAHCKTEDRSGVMCGRRLIDKKLASASFKAIFDKT